MNHVINYQPIAQHTFNRKSPFVKHVRQELRSVGISGFDLLKPETYSIARVLMPNELILAAICGKVNNEGSALLVVTDKRVIYLNEIPLFTNMDEVGYGVVTGISSEVGRWDATITLHTGIKDFTMHSINTEAANNFVYIVERYCITPGVNILKSPVKSLVTA